MKEHIGDEATPANRKGIGQTGWQGMTRQAGKACSRTYDTSKPYCADPRALSRTSYQQHDQPVGMQRGRRSDVCGEVGNIPALLALVVAQVRDDHFHRCARACVCACVRVWRRQRR